MTRPSFQFYPADWRSNGKLRRCSEAARGAWIDVLCVLHDSDEYGVVRWSLSELIRVAGIPRKLGRELIANGVLKGCDNGEVRFFHTPRHANIEGIPVVLVSSKPGEPCWFSSRMVVDEWRRQRSGGNTKFSSTNQPDRSPGRRQGERLGGDDSRSPSHRLVNGSSTSTSSSPSGSVPKGTGADGAGIGKSEDADKPDWWPKRDRYGRVLGEFDDKLIYAVGKAVLGKSSGGQVTKMLKLEKYRRDRRAAVELLLKADDTAEAAPWFAQALRKAEIDEPIVPQHEIYPEREYRV